MSQNSLLFRTVLALWLPAAAVAQVAGTISGFINDASGAPVPAAKVTALLVEQQLQRTAETNAEGFYTLNALPPGTFTINAEKAGFERLVRTGAVLTVNQNLRIDMTLQVGQISAEVTVTGQAPQVDTRSGTLSGLVDDRRVVLTIPIAHVYGMPPGRR